MKLTFGALLFVITICLSNAQYGNVELSTGGFSFIPAFTDTNPNIIFNAGTGTQKRLSAHLIGSVRTADMSPRGFIFITRLKLIDKKFKLNLGTHLPAVQVDENHHMDTFFAQEITMSYPVSEKWMLSSMYIHGKGKNNDLEINLLTVNAQTSWGRFGFLSQGYILDLDQTFGVAETVSYSLNPRFTLKGFVNQTLSNNDFKWTLGLAYKL